MIRLRPSGADEVLIKRVRDWYEPGPGVFIAPQALFNPALLFTTGVAGAWYDPSDFTTLFQDAAGTTPVTAVEQPVGLMLDKSKGLVLGPELVTNGDFATDTAWTKGVGWTISGGSATHAAGTASYLTSNPATTLTAGKTYLVTYTISNYSAGVFWVEALGGGVGVNRTSNGAFTEYYSPTASGTLRIYGNVSAAGSIDNISVRELPGNHAFNPSGNSANFPVLSARYNLQAGSQVASGWTGQGTTPPIVTNSVSYLGESCVAVTFGPLNSPGYANSRAAYSANDVITVLGEKYITSFNISLSRDLVGSESIVVYYTGSNGLGNATINAANSSSFVGQWNRITTAAVTAVVGGAVRIYSYNGQVLTSDVTVYINKADLRVSNDALNQPDYQRVNTSTDYDTVGFKPYLKFNGTNQWLQTNSIDFTYGDKMFVAAGVRKLSDAARGMLVEFGAALSTQIFNIEAPDANTANTYKFRSSGTAIQDAIATGYSAPVTNVLSGIGNISGDQAILRVNGTQAAISTGDQGTGNYGNYPIYIGARAGSSLWFNGRLHQLVVAGKQASASEIGQTEAFTNQKTGAY